MPGWAWYKLVAGATAVATLMALPALTANAEQITQGGLSSDNVEWLAYLPMPAHTIGGTYAPNTKTFFASDWESGLYAYDASDPTNPRQVGHLGPDQVTVQAVENENLATNGKILLLSRLYEAPVTDELIVIDVHDPAHMRVLATLAGAGGHTMECLYDCTWAYGSASGVGADTIVDLHDPAHPVLRPEQWTAPMAGVKVHNVSEAAQGVVVTSSDPMYVLDTTDPVHPKALMHLPSQPDTSHSNVWPRHGADRFLLSQSEAVNNGRCEAYAENGKTLQVWDTSGWQTNHYFRPLGKYSLVNGTFTDGNPAVDIGFPQGCSAHWMDMHSTFYDGGLMVMAAFSHGARILNISAAGQPQEIGWFISKGMSTVDASWITDRILYVLDVGSGGLDVIRYKGEIPKRGSLSREGLMQAGVGGESGTPTTSGYRYAELVPLLILLLATAAGFGIWRRRRRPRAVRRARS